MNLALFAAMIKARYPAEIRIDVAEFLDMAITTVLSSPSIIRSMACAFAQGGRYDGVGDIFGRARAATGFDLNSEAVDGQLIPGVMVTLRPIPLVTFCAWPCSRLRGEGHRVIVAAAKTSNRHMIASACLCRVKMGGKCSPCLRGKQHQ